MRIKKAVFPVAGIGTRFFPATKVSPKEMLPIVDKPLVQYAVEEAIKAGFSEMIFVTCANKHAIEDHFEKDEDLERHLEKENKWLLLEKIQEIRPNGIQFTYVHQDEPLGLGHALLCAEEAINGEPFAVLLADDLIIDSQFPCLSGMLKHYQQDQKSIIAVQSIAWHDVSGYGIAQLEDAESNYSRIKQMVEKPKPDEAPSNLAAIGRYLLNSSIFHYLKQIQTDLTQELQLTDAIHLLLQQEAVYAYQFSGKRHDCGSKLGFLEANISLGLQHPEIGPKLQRYLHELMGIE